MLHAMRKRRSAGAALLTGSVKGHGLGAETNSSAGSGVGRREILRATAPALIPLGTNGCAVAQQTSAQLEGIAVSPDGETIAFQFSVPFVDELGSRVARGLGLYAWRSGALTRIPNPPGMQLGDPSFAPDGRRLVCLSARRGARSWFSVAILELPSLVHRLVVPDLGNFLIRGGVVFQPGTDRILFGMANVVLGQTELVLQPVASGQREIVLHQNESFRYIDSLTFAGPQEILFQGLSTRTPRLVARLAEFGLRHTSQILCRIRIGGQPEIFFPRTAPTGTRAGDPFQATGVAASRDGATTVTVTRSLAQPSGARGRHNSEVFRIEADGRLTPLTQILGRLGYVGIAYNGEVVGFGNDPERRNRFDLWTLDMRTGAVADTGLMRRVLAHPDFAFA